MGNRKSVPSPPEVDFAYAFFLSDNGNITYDWIAGPFAQVTGHPSDTLHQCNWNELIYPKDKPLLDDRIKILRSGRGDSREYRILTADGHLRWVRDYAQPVRYQRNGDLLVFATVQDITAQKRTEVEMRRIASIVESSQDAITDISLDGVIMTWNRSAECIYGYSADEVKGRTISMLVPADQMDETARILASVRRDGSVPRMETLRIRKDGTVIPVALTAGPVHDASGQLIGAAIISRDISELKRAESALQESASKTAAILDTMVDAVITIDEHGGIDSFNPAAERIFGYTAAEVFGKNVNMLMPEPYRGEHDDYLRNYIRSGKAKIIGLGREVVGKRKDDSIFPMDLAVSEVFLGARRLFTGIVRDLTDRKRLERQILEISDREQQRIGQDLHDGLGQQLAGIGFLSKYLEQRLTKKKSPESEDARQIAQLVSEAIAQARGMAHGLNPVDLSATGFTAALRKLAATVENTFRIACSFQCDVPVFLDNSAVGTHLYRIAQEAVNNAIKHGHAKQISIVLNRAGDTITLSVRDDGVGFPDSLPKDKGIGLQTMRYRAALIGATLSILKVPAGGTRVDCSLKDVGSAGERTSDGKEATKTKSPARKTPARLAKKGLRHR